MAHQIIQLPDTVELARVFFRFPAESESLAVLVPTDFNRRRMKDSTDWKEPGISLFQLDLISLEAARARVPSRSLKGLATTRAKALRSAGYRFAWTADNPEHMSLRCPECNLNLSMETYCLAADGPCGLDKLFCLPQLTTLMRLFQPVIPAHAA